LGLQKNSLFAGSDGGGRTWATIATLLQTAKMNNVDPLAWLTQTLERIANGWPSSEIDALITHAVELHRLNVSATNTPPFLLRSRPREQLLHR
jgi:hypothetical protein